MQIVDTRFGLNTTVSVSIRRYQSGELAIELVEEETGEPWSCASCATGQVLPPNSVGIKDWSENEGMSALLIQGGVIEGAPITHIPSGFVTIPVYRLTSDAIALIPQT